MELRYHNKTFNARFEILLIMLHSDKWIYIIISFYLFKKLVKNNFKNLINNFI